MSVKIDIQANDQQTADAVAIAVHAGLEQAGFQSVSTDVVIAEGTKPESVLEAMQRTAPEMFATPIAISAVALNEEEPEDEQEEETADTAD